MEFQIVQWQAEDYKDGYGYEETAIPKYLIKIYGITEDGDSVSVNILDYTPFFMIKVPHAVTSLFMERIHEHMTLQLPLAVRPGYVGAKLMKRKDFWGFTNNTLFSFVRFTFKSLAAFKAGIRVMQKPVLEGRKYAIYESNIEPFLRFMHIRNLAPAGWVVISDYTQNTDILPTRCVHDLSCDWKAIMPVEKERLAPIKIAAFDIECTSSHGDFPVAIKDYKKVAYEINQAFVDEKIQTSSSLIDALESAFTGEPGILSPIYTKRVNQTSEKISKIAPKIIQLMQGKQKEAVQSLLDANLPKLKGDPIIQIGITLHKYGEIECYSHHIVTVGTCDSIENAIVHSCATEKEALLQFTKLIQDLDPDVITGYNIFGFDFAYLYDRSCELGISERFLKLGKIVDQPSLYEEKTLSSSALGDNLLRYVNMQGRVLIDVMKVVQRDHKLDSFKLDNVAKHFLKLQKNDVSPQDIFRLQEGSSEDRKKIAEYCIQDCALCNRLIMKLEILANNIGMANVCNVPLTYIFMRGQGVKIFSLVAKQCREEDFMIPTLSKYGTETEEEDDEGYEGAIVLPPKEGIYLDTPITVLDYASLYPSSMISENLSHDTYVLNPKYDNLPGVEYLDITYDIYDTVDGKKKKVGDKVCRFVQTKEKGVMPRILMKLLKARKDTRKKIEYQTVITKNEKYSGLLSENADAYTLKRIDGTSDVVPKSEVIEVVSTYGEFEKAVLDGLQLAYKVTANSLYGQVGAKTSPIYLKEIAACTTATGRKMILMAKDFMEGEYNAEIIYGDSVPGNSPVMIRHKDGSVHICPIETLTREWQSYPGFKMLEQGRYDKEQGFIDAEVWAGGRWAKIFRVIRHRTHKKIYRVNTPQGCIDVTEDHSLIDANMQRIQPKECVIGKTELYHSFPEEFPEIEPWLKAFDDVPKRQITKHEAWVFGLFLRRGNCIDSWEINDSNVKYLDIAREYLCAVEPIDFEVLESSGNYKLVSVSSSSYMVEKYRELFHYRQVPSCILNAPYQIRSWFMKGYLQDDGMQLVCKEKIEAQSLYYLACSLGWKNIGVNIQENNYIIGNMVDNMNPNRIITMTSISDCEDTVYDIETEVSRFHSGVGSIIKSNTDSLFLSFKVDEKGHAAILPSIKKAQEASAAFKPKLKAPHDLEYEKTFWPFILFSKKRYCANKYEFDDQHCKLNSMGIALKRRDNAPIVKQIYGGVLDIILNQQDIQASTSYLRDQLTELIAGKFPLESLVITKSLRADYKDPSKIAHKVLAERIGERDPGNKPQVNERIPFVYVETKGKKGEKILQGNRIEHPDYIRQQNLKPDYEFYITNQIMKPVVQLYALTITTLDGYRKGPNYFNELEHKLIQEKEGDVKKAKDRLNDLKEQEVARILFEPHLRALEVKKTKNKLITDFFSVKK